MNKKTLFLLWGCLFILCAALGFIQEPAGALKNLMFFISLLFFLPPAWILEQSLKKKDLQTLRLLRNLSSLSLLLTLLLIVVNIMSVLGSQLLGDILHSILTIVSAPMLCCGNWFLSMFLWACLMIVSIQGIRQAK